MLTSLASIQLESDSRRFGNPNRFIPVGKCSRAGRCTNRARRGNTPCKSASVPPAHLRSSYRGRGRLEGRGSRHRVKNNFQLVLSSISLQKRRHQGAEVQSALAHVASRINAISLAHDQLAPGQEGQTVRLTDYVHALCSAIQQQVRKSNSSSNPMSCK